MLSRNRKFVCFFLGFFAFWNKIFLLIKTWSLYKISNYLRFVKSIAVLNAGLYCFLNFYVDYDVCISFEEICITEKSEVFGRLCIPPTSSWSWLDNWTWIAWKFQDDQQLCTGCNILPNQPITCQFSFL